MIAIGSDHGGYLLKEEIKKHLKEKGYEFKDFGTDSTASCDYPVYAEKVCRAVQSGECEKGILICGTGIGMSMCANKCKGIRAAVCGDHFSAEFTRKHNNANVLCLGARVIGAGVAMQLVDIFLTTEYEGGRHEKRVEMMMQLENE
ncbi:MAG: ribose 5-phosphate isomerase B [Oscillospiraceae bacterium]|nr:ribose 5-phosphate isomerase B [Oscillospiraceae bacterium]